MDSFTANKPGWRPTPNDYRLIFTQASDGYWREITNNLPEYGNMVLAEYLDEMGIYLPDDCQFCRIVNDNIHFEYRAYGGQIRIDVEIYK